MGLYSLTYPATLPYGIVILPAPTLCVSSMTARCSLPSFCSVRTSHPLGIRRNEARRDWGVDNRPCSVVQMARCSLPSFSLVCTSHPLGMRRDEARRDWGVKNRPCVALTCLLASRFRHHRLVNLHSREVPAAPLKRLRAMASHSPPQDPHKTSSLSQNDIYDI